jgi:hypothetical protein
VHERGEHIDRARAAWAVSQPVSQSAFASHDRERRKRLGREGKKRGEGENGRREVMMRESEERSAGSFLGGVRIILHNIYLEIN